MEISKSFANQMVEELSGIIHQHINFMDKNGIIIASTDKSRIDSCHVGAQQLLNQSLSYLIIDSDHEYPGSKKGVNLPIVIHGQVVGVIGITGERRMVEKYGEIIKKFTEMYIRDNTQRLEREMEHKIRDRFLEQWVTSSEFSKDHNFIDLGLSVGVDVMMKRRIIQIKCMVEEEPSMKEVQQRIDMATKRMKQVLCLNNQHFMLRIGAKLVFLTHDWSDEEILTKCRCLAHDMNAMHGVQVNIGIDEKGRQASQLPISYAQAKKSLSACHYSTGQQIKTYRDLNLELFLHDVTPAMKHEFISRVFGSCTQSEVDEYRIILSLLYQHNGSIEKTAKDLFIHKNTLQYKLNKLNELSGYNPRNLSDCVLFQLALRFYELLQES